MDKEPAGPRLFNLLFIGVRSFLTLGLWGALLIGVIAYRSYRAKNPGNRPKSVSA